MKPVNPVNYRIRLEPDLVRFTFQGRVEISIDLPEGAGEITLNALELAVWSCRTEVEGETVECPFEVNPKKQELRIALPKMMEGGIRLSIDYMGRINNHMAGFYQSRSVYQGGEKVAAVTQFEESDARRAFPCFDHPRKKATFDIEMVVDGGLSAISNEEILGQEPAGQGRNLVKFHRTPRMSTYLLFFGVGDFESIEDPGEVPVRVATRKGMSGYGRFALEFGRKALAFSEEYYGIKYPAQGHCLSAPG